MVTFIYRLLFKIGTILDSIVIKLDLLLIKIAKMASFGLNIRIPK